MRHNNVIPNVHYRKNYKRWIKTWYNQPGRKQSRRIARQKAISEAGFRPVGMLRPIVHPPTQRYNMKTRLGRGFTLEELSACGINKKAAMSIGIAVDHRRTDASEETFQVNVNRLRNYINGIILMPRKGKKTKKGFAGIPDDSSKQEFKSVKNVSFKKAFPLVSESIKEKTHTITSEERKFRAYATLRKQLLEAKNLGKKLAEAKKAE
ncbi:60S ribosomal L13 [Cryptosporidium bovis]|uniref:60S ribosomal L13 n=1 Tax=Cryptosporidium bovis TaxID=310047 RepID=UPI00351A57C6|nr:60S ribosomal L13 [Cryptosporidium bovis]